MASTHTPGPWTEEWMRPNKAAGHTFEPLCSITGIDPEFGKVRLADIPDPRDATAEANARLIAAAPELLAALNDLVNMVNGNRLNDTVVRNAEAAIAKAERR